MAREPKKDCKMYEPPIKQGNQAKCSALKKLYCQEEKCSWYKPKRKSAFDELEKE